MIHDIEEHLTAGMREHVASIKLSPDIVEGAKLRHRRHRFMWRTTYAAGVIGLAGVVAAVAAGTGTIRMDDGVNRPIVNDASARLELASAIANSGKLSYKFKIMSTINRSGDVAENSTTGAFDPATATGFLVTSFGFEERLINRVRYTAGVYPSGIPTDAKFTRDPLMHDELPFLSGGRFDVALEDPGMGPQRLLEVLAQDQAKITRVGPDTYHFEINQRVEGRDSPEPVPTSTSGTTRPVYPEGSTVIIGDISLDAGKRIAKLSYHLVWEAPASPGPASRCCAEKHVDARQTMEFYDYGTTVTVEVPTNLVVRDDLMISKD